MKEQRRGLELGCSPSTITPPAYNQTNTIFFWPPKLKIKATTGTMQRMGSPPDWGPWGAPTSSLITAIIARRKNYPETLQILLQCLTP